MNIHRLLNGKNQIFVCMLILSFLVLPIGVAGTLFTFNPDDIGLGTGTTDSNNVDDTGMGISFPGTKGEVEIPGDATSHLEIISAILVQNKVTEEVNFVFGGKNDWYDGIGGNHPWNFTNDKKCALSCDAAQVDFCRKNSEETDRSAEICVSHPDVCRGLLDIVTETPWCFDPDSEAVFTLPLEGHFSPVGDFFSAGEDSLSSGSSTNDSNPSSDGGCPEGKICDPLNGDVCDPSWDICNENLCKRCAADIARLGQTWPGRLKGCVTSPDRCDGKRSEVASSRGHSDSAAVYGFGGSGSAYIGANGVSYMSNPKFLRFEGDMRAASKMKHTMNPGKEKGASQAGNSENILKSQTAEYGIGIDVKDTSKYEWFSEDSFYHEIDWDRNPDQCNVMGGDYGDYGCCGDDWHWVFNMPYGYDADIDADKAAEFANENMLCVWSNSPEYGIYVPTKEGYRCDPTGFLVYDTGLEEDNDNTTFGSREDKYFFAGTGDMETDVGRWNDMFCQHDFDSSKGDVFKWVSLKEAGDANAVNCELFLGNNWTGSKCCLDGRTYSDRNFHCDAEAVGTEVLNAGFGLESPDFLTTFEERCEEVKDYNRACLDGESLENGDVGTEKTDGDIVNSEGQLFRCTDSSASEIELSIKGESDVLNAGSCQIVGFSEDVLEDEKDQDNGGLLDKVNDKTGIGSDLESKQKDDLRVCSVTEGWKKLGDEFTTKIMNYNSGLNKTDITSKTHYSSVPSVATEEYYSECCFENSCFDGKSCVDEYSTYVINSDDGNFEPYDYSIYDTTGELRDEEAYRCVGGEWMGPLNGDLNWYDDYRYKEFCADDKSCMCSEVPTPSYDFTCGEGFVTSGCTNTKNYYVADHLCYDNNGNADWTSRTKILVLKLLSYARTINSNDYTIYCDEIKNVVNNEMVSEVIGDSINGFCVLNASGDIYAGFTMNSEDKDMDVNLSDVLLNDYNGLIKIIMPEYYETLTNIGIEGSAEILEEMKDSVNSENKFFFYRIFGGKALYNSAFEMIIFAPEDSAAFSNTLVQSPFDFDAYNSEFERKLQKVKSFTKIYYNNFVDKGMGSAVDFIQRSRDLNRFYISRIDDKEIFAFVETKYDLEEVSLSSVVAGYYDNIEVNCDEIEQTYSNSVCLSKGSNSVIVDKSKSSTFSYWQDLGSKLRLSID